MADTLNIRVYNGAAFNKQFTVKSKTVGALRKELDIPSIAKVSVDGGESADSFKLTDNVVVSWIDEDKTGGNIS